MAGAPVVQEGNDQWHRQDADEKHPVTRCKRHELLQIIHDCVVKCWTDVQDGVVLACRVDAIR